jgi:hypothetical protein
MGQQPKYSSAALRAIREGQRRSWTPARKELAAQRLRRAHAIVNDEREDLRGKIKEESLNE